MTPEDRSPKLASIKKVEAGIRLNSKKINSLNFTDDKIYSKKLFKQSVGENIFSSKGVSKLIS